MRGALVAFVAGLGTAAGVAWLFENNASFRKAALDASDRVQRSARSIRSSARRMTSKASQIETADLNTCSNEDLLRIGLSDDLAERILENRPYRNRLDLLSRLVIPDDVYQSIKHAVGVDVRSANEPVKVAS